MKIKLFLVLGVLVGLFAVAVPVSSTTYSVPSVHLDGVVFVGCTSTDFTLTYNIHHDYTAAQAPVYITSYLNVNGVFAVQEEMMFPVNTPGFIEPRIYLFTIGSTQTATYTFDWYVETYDSSQKLRFVTHVKGKCNFNGATWTPGAINVIYNDFSGGVSSPAAPVPGCDVLIPIPETAVSGKFLESVVAQWAPGKETYPPVILPGGASAWVLGVDESGGYYKIIWSCDHLWVPVDAMGPNYDDVWQGWPLPTEVVE